MEIIKISVLEKAVLCITAAFLLITAGYFMGLRNSAEPYRVEVEYRAEPETLILPTPTPAQTQNYPINLNTATADELQALPGIGEKRAQDIVADRAANGPFRIPEEITRVKGIGEGTLVGIIDYITVGDAAPSPG